MAVLRNAAGTHHLVVRRPDVAEGDHVPPEGGTFADNGVPMPVEWRPLDDARLDVPLYPDGLRALLG